MRKNPETYIHLDPGLVGNENRILVSEHSGSSTILEKVQKGGLELQKGSPEIKEILKQVTALESIKATRSRARKPRLSY